MICQLQFWLDDVYHEGCEGHEIDLTDPLQQQVHKPFIL